MIFRLNLPGFFLFYDYQYYVYQQILKFVWKCPIWRSRHGGISHFEGNIVTGRRIRVVLKIGVRLRITIAQYP
jgi:hypothetical protein